MGTWGPGIFSDDFACDVRNDFRELIGEGLDSAAATVQLEEQYKDVIGDPEDDERDVFWIALAATQTQCGRLQERVRTKALVVIDSGADLRRWMEEEDRSLLRRRKRALEKLRVRLLGPQRAPTKIRRIYHDRTQWNRGDVVAYTLRSGRRVLLRVVDIDEQKKSRTAIVELCDWVGHELPDRAAVAELPTRRSASDKSHAEEGSSAALAEGHAGRFAIYALKPRDFPENRVKLIYSSVWQRNKPWRPAYYFGGWARLDSYLEKYFGLV